MEIKKYKVVPKLNMEERRKQTEVVIEFLKKVHPSLAAEGFNEGATELRPIKRGSKVYVRSYNCFRFKEKDIKYLNKFLDTLNGENVCIYWSIFEFDNKKECFDDKGKPMVKGKANTQNALYTQVLAMDFDHINEEEFLQEKQRLLDLGIETFDVFTGHGFQSLILLRFKNYDLEIQKKFTRLMLSKGFKVDLKIVDAARVLRVPNTFNCKGALKGEDIVQTYIYNDTDERYTKESIFEKINSLPTVVEINEDDFFTQKGEMENENNDNKHEILAEKIIEKNEDEIEAEALKKASKIKISKEELNAKIGSISEVYPTIKLDDIPIQIQKMLVYAPKGTRNSVLLFLIPFFKNSLKYSKAKIKTIIKIWGNRCDYGDGEVNIEDEIERIYNYNFGGKIGQYTEELAKIYGYIDFTKITNNKNCVISNKFFDMFDILTDGEVRIYITMALLRANGAEKYTINDVCSVAKINPKTFQRNIKKLIDKEVELVIKTKTSRTKGEAYIYYINPYHTTNKNFTIFDKSSIKLMLLELTDGEIKVFSYLKRLLGDNSNVWASQRTIAKNLNKSLSGISYITDNLHEKTYIQKETKLDGKVLKCEYFINY